MWVEGEDERYIGDKKMNDVSPVRDCLDEVYGVDEG
jgi:hypothetical protein